MKQKCNFLILQYNSLCEASICIKFRLHTFVNVETGVDHEMSHSLADYYSHGNDAYTYRMRHYS